MFLSKEFSENSLKNKKKFKMKLWLDGAISIWYPWNDISLEHHRITAYFRPVSARCLSQNYCIDLLMVSQKLKQYTRLVMLGAHIEALLWDKQKIKLGRIYLGFFVYLVWRTVGEEELYGWADGKIP